MTNTSQYIKCQLAEKGFRITPQRETVITVMADNRENHLSIEEIYDLARVKNPKIGIATVYRTLVLLNQLDLVQKLDLGDNLSRYEIRTDMKDAFHHHLLCMHCHQIISIREDLLETNLIKQVSQNYHFTLMGPKLVLCGICSDCARKLAPPG